ncbi:hypothetical protein LIV57_11550 [Chryseobacterium sp. X308]|uniref:RHS repeat-associated core domain-containing protein n=1 Tax=Chryseobacterium sp. X308 TaxID=2884873 RepID=UPI001D14E125|nr:RHS repeat-associated core domain-containing protein [Chryseobacterium sp. X308]MCC3215899.1 hypothetical protein [Chryseobacterium sp. X308]
MVSNTLILKYNEEELQETGLYSYGWRDYMPDIGRWNGIDQLAESYLSTSPYAYVANNPVSQFDVDGRWFNEDGTIDTSGRTPGFTSGRQMYNQFLGYRPGDGGGSIDYSLLDGLRNEWAKKGIYTTISKNGYMSWWTGGAEGDANTAQEMVAHLLKLGENASNNWYGLAGKGNWFFGIAGSVSLLQGSLNSERMYAQGIRRGITSNYVLKGRNLSLFGKMPVTDASLPIAKMTKIGSAIGKYSFFLGVAFDGIGVINYATNPNSTNAVDPRKAGLNTLMGYIGWKGGAYGAAISTIYFGVDNFYPGGWVGASETAARTEEYEQHITGHPFFSNSAIKF